MNIQTLRIFVQNLLLEGFQDDKQFLIDKNPNNALDLASFNPKQIAWLTARFNPAKKSVKEVHSISDCIDLLKTFASRESSIGQKWKSNDFFRTSIEEKYADANWEKKWNTPNDITHMTFDELSFINEMAVKKAPKVILKSEKEEEKEPEPQEKIGKVGPWNIWLPHSMNDSIEICGYDKEKLIPHTTWCTNYITQQNLFYSYNSMGQMLIYVIRDNPHPKKPEGRAGLRMEHAFDYISLGFLNGVLELKDNGPGGRTVCRDNVALTDKDLHKIFGQYYDQIMKIVTDKVAEVSGNSPASFAAIKALQSMSDFKKFTATLSKKIKTEEVQRIYRENNGKIEINDEVAKEMANFMTLNTAFSIDNPDSNLVNYLIKNPDLKIENRWESYLLCKKFGKVKYTVDNAKNVVKYVTKFAIFDAVTAASAWNDLLDNQLPEFVRALQNFENPVERQLKIIKMSKSSNPQEISQSLKENGLNKNIVIDNIVKNPATGIEDAMKIYDKFQDLQTEIVNSNLAIQQVIKTADINFIRKYSSVSFVNRVMLYVTSHTKESFPMLKLAIALLPTMTSFQAIQWSQKLEKASDVNTYKDACKDAIKINDKLANSISLTNFLGLSLTAEQQNTINQIDSLSIDDF